MIRQLWDQKTPEQKTKMKEKQLPGQRELQMSLHGYGCKEDT